MQSPIPVTQDQLTQQERLTIWMRRQKVTAYQISKFAGVRENTVYRWLRAEKLPWHRVQVLRDFGIPEELLPEAERMHGQGAALPAVAAQV